MLPLQIILEFRWQFFNTEIVIHKLEAEFFIVENDMTKRTEENELDAKYICEALHIVHEIGPADRFGAYEADIHVRLAGPRKHMFGCFFCA